MTVIVFQNYPCEDAATAGEAFRRLGHETRVVDCYNGQTVPDAEGDALLVLGGPMNVYEEERYPFLRWETDFIARWVNTDKPFLGLCLGAQLLSKAMGGRVNRNPSREIGHFDVELTAAGRSDPLFGGFPVRFPVIQWHGDTFTIPEGGHHLARSDLCENQALRVRRAVGLQFHLEIGREKMASWIREYIAEAKEAEVDIPSILARFDALETEYARTCYRLIDNFCRS